MKTKIVFAVVVGAFMLLANNALFNVIQPELQTELAMEQMVNPSLEVDTASRYLSAVTQSSIFLVGYLFFVLWLFKSELLNFLKGTGMRSTTAVLLGLFIISGLGCMKPYHEKVLVDLQPQEVGILIETINDEGQAIVGPPRKIVEDSEGKINAEGVAQKNNDTHEYYSSRIVNAKKIEVPFYWKQTNRKMVWSNDNGNNGAWHPSARLIVVDTAPETRKWDTKTNKAIWAESKDSVGFSTGIGITARIDNKLDAVKFLSNYPPESRRKVVTNNGAFEVEVTSLSQVMDEEIQQKVEEFYVDECTQHDMDILRTQKKEILDKVRGQVIPFFAERGITITSISQFGGFTYETPNVQKSIDEVFQAQQDKMVARAETQAAEERKQALKLIGEGEGDKILQQQLKEAEGIKAIADAKAYELQQLQSNPEAYLRLKMLEIEMARLQAWDGKYPSYLFQTGSDGDKLSMPQLLLTTPQDKSGN